MVPCSSSMIPNSAWDFSFSSSTLRPRLVARPLPRPCHMSYQRERRPGRFCSCVIYFCLPVIPVTSLSSLLDTCSCTALPVSRGAKDQPCQVCGKVWRRRNNAGKSWKAEYCAKCNHCPHWHSSLTVLFKYLTPHLVDDIKVSKCNGQGNWVRWEFLKIFCSILTVTSPSPLERVRKCLHSSPQNYGTNCRAWIVSSGIWRPTELMPASQLSHHKSEAECSFVLQSSWHSFSYGPIQSVLM